MTQPRSNFIEMRPLGVVESALELAQAGLPGYYLQRFSVAERKAFTEKYARPEPDLEKLLQEHRKYLYACYTNYTIALLMTQMFVVFQTNTSLEGIPEIAKIIYPGANLSNEATYGIAIPMAIASSIFMLTLFSPYKNAVEATLNHATRPDLKTRLQVQRTQLQEQPCVSLANAAKWTIHNTIIMTANVTGASSYVLEIDPYLRSLHPAARWSVIAPIIYFGNQGYGCFMTPSYYQGVEFWFSKKYPWLLAEISRGNIATPLQVSLQALSSVALRVYPTFYYIGIAAEKTFGWWLPAPVVATVVALHGLCVLYPSTYKYYLENKIKLGALTEGEQQPRPARSFNLFSKSPSTAVPLAYRGFLGGYFGYSVLAPLLLSVIDEPYSMNILSVLAGVSLFAGLLYRAERERVFAATEVKAREDNIPVLEREKDCLAAAAAAASIMAVGANIGGVLSTIGVLVRLIGNDSPAIVTMIALIAVERMINLILFALPRTVDNVRNGLVSTTNLFCRRNAALDVAPVEESVAPVVVPAVEISAPVATEREHRHHHRRRHR